MPRKIRVPGQRVKYTYDCNQCGKTYHPTKKAHDKYCSRECGWAGNKVYWGEYCKITSKPKKRLSEAEIITIAEVRKVMVEAKRIEGLKEERSNHSCPQCDIRFCPTIGERARLCLECVDINSAISKKKGRKAHNHRIRARKLGVKCESFDPLLVMWRDEWKCQGCGCDTPEELRGTSEDDAPELDHIIPLSKGGEHTINNTQCLCRVCNLMKSDKTMIEFNQWNQQDGMGTTFL